MSIDYINEIAEKIANQFSVDFILPHKNGRRVHNSAIYEKGC